MNQAGPTLWRLFEDFERSALVEGTTKHKCRTAIRKLIGIVGDIEAASLTVPMIGQFQATMKNAGLAPASVHSYAGGVAQVYVWAVENGVLQVNPFEKAKRVRAVRRDIRVIPAADIKDLCRAAVGLTFERDTLISLRWSAILEVTSTSALRAGELQNLRWEDIDLDAGTVHVAYRPDRRGEYWRWGTKGKTDRMVPLSRRAIRILHRLRKAAPWRYPFLKRRTCLRMQRHIGDLPELARKQPYHNLHRELEEIEARANRHRAEKGLPCIHLGGLHVLRKTAITNWAASGAPMPAVQYAAGHASMQTTRDYYIHLDRLQAVGQIRAVIDRKSL